MLAPLRRCTIITAEASSLGHWDGFDPGSLFRERPHAVPAGVGCRGAELCDPTQECRARSVTGHDLETVFEPGARLIPILAAIGAECGAKGIAQRQALATDFAFAPEQFKDALRLGLADDQYLVDLAGLHQIGGKTAGSFADKRARTIDLVRPFQARGQIDGIADYRVVARLL